MHKGISNDSKKEFLKSTVPGLAKSKNYYMKFIHEENNTRVKASNNATAKYIPQNETEKKTYEQRFKFYMN